MKLIDTISGLVRTVDELRSGDAPVALVPTMGALHAGHLALVQRAKRRSSKVIVSIFVNPAQFAPSEDFGSYPRSLDADLTFLTEAGADVVWAPPVDVMYPSGFATQVVPGGPAVVGLEDAFRPHFFAGVATVVTKLFLQCRPDLAVFGEKDYQQLKVVTAMARDLNIPVRIAGVPTVRDPDGLAQSSRNAYLSPDQRKRAPAMYRALKQCASDLRSGRSLALALSRARRSMEEAGFELDYVEARDSETLERLGSPHRGMVRLLAAARLGKTRLIDNIAA